MSTKQQTTQNSSFSNTTGINYDPTAMGQYLQNISSIMPVMRQYATNPFGNPFYQINRAMMNNVAVQQGQTNANTITSNAQQQGFGGNAGFVQSNLARAGRATSALQFQGQYGAMKDALSNQWNALGLLSSFQPLMTGSTASGNSNMNQTTTTSGLGTWLPQLAGAAIGGFTGGLGGSLGGKLFSGFGGGGGGGGLPGVGGNPGIMGNLPGVNYGGLGGLSFLNSPGFFNAPTYSGGFSGLGVNPFNIPH